MYYCGVRLKCLRQTTMCISQDSHSLKETYVVTKEVCCFLLARSCRSVYLNLLITHYVRNCNSAGPRGRTPVWIRISAPFQTSPGAQPHIGHSLGKGGLGVALTTHSIQR